MRVGTYLYIPPNCIYFQDTWEQVSFHFYQVREVPNMEPAISSYLRQVACLVPKSSTLQSPWGLCEAANPKSNSYRLPQTSLARSLGLDDLDTLRVGLDALTFPPKHIHGIYNMMPETSVRQTGAGAAVTNNGVNRDYTYPLRCDQNPILDVDDTFKRSGPHNLNRTGYDEESEYKFRFSIVYPR